ncbi:MAG: hypothetical protein V2I74_05245, partial [Erythrobacter sp.]|nr:hypothetical protein [Erythrobacter sp.]
MSWNLALTQIDQRLAGSLADDPDRIFRQLGSQLDAGGSGVSTSYLNEVREAARRDPLSDEVFLVEALVSRSQGRFREGLIRLEQARKRDP